MSLEISRVPGVSPSDGMTHTQPCSLAHLIDSYDERQYVETLLSCANSRTDRDTLESIYKEFFASDQVGEWREDGMDLSQLSRIMAYKLSRGKWRPRLQQLVESNAEAEVREVTKAAAGDADLRRRMQTLCKLKAVGPATASLILTILDADVPFYSDEFAAFHLGEGRLKYDLKEYLNLIDIHQDWLESELHEMKDHDVKLSGRAIEQMIWLWSRSKTRFKDDPVSSSKKRTGDDQDHAKGRKTRKKT